MKSGDSRLGQRKKEKNQTNKRCPVRARFGLEFIECASNDVK